MHYKLNFCVIYIIWLFKSSNTNYCVQEQECTKEAQSYRYLFYDVNPPEGFNLRRDVFMRFVIFAYNLKNHRNTNLNNFKLVLPPWTNMYHWKEKRSVQIPWSYFFDVDSIRKFAPVIEMHQFFDEIENMNRYSKFKIDEVYVLQNFEDMFKTGKFEDKMLIEKCEKVTTNFFHYKNITAENIRCLSFHGHATQLSKILAKSNAKTVLFDHAEIALHDYFGDALYWKARRSMRFNKHLINIAAKFRQDYLNSNDIDDNTVLPEDWRDETPRRSAKGGPYLAVHLRRNDFAWGHPNLVPTIKHAAKQIRELLNKLKLKKVFIATDSDEYEEIEDLLNSHCEVYKFVPTYDSERNLSEGQLAIIDQIICSHSSYFVGTHESTFSFRIQEEREIFGFSEDTTFNTLCKETNCEEPSKWKIVY